MKEDDAAKSAESPNLLGERLPPTRESKVGSIRNANEGVFSILPADQASDGAEGDFGGADASLMKTVRVVTSVEYYPEK